MVLISFKDLYEIHIFPKFRRCGSKIVPATPFWNLNFKWAWQAQFLSHTYETLEKYVFYIDLEMILVPFFDIPNQKPVNWKRLNFLDTCQTSSSSVSSYKKRILYFLKEVNYWQAPGIDPRLPGWEASILSIIQTLLGWRWWFYWTKS